MSAALIALALAPTRALAQPEVEIEVEDDDEIEIESESQPQPAAVPAPTEDLAARAELDALEARLLALEAPSPEPLRPPERGPRWLDPSALSVSGYLQPQLVVNQLSQDELSPDGTALNQDRFLVRRARLRVERSWRYASTVLELDANTVRGPFLSVRRAEGSLIVPNERTQGLPPYLQLTAGLSEIPFGYELTQGHANRLFMERTAGSLALFRGEPDVGVQVAGGLGPLRYALALQNGVPIDDRPGASSTPFNHQKTALGRVGFDAGSGGDDVWKLSGGASLLEGQGFHAGTPATKSSLLWLDSNQDGFVTLNELVPTPGQAATPSETFQRWGIAGDVQLGLSTPAGWTRAYAELTMASNLDRAFFVADPIAAGRDLRELAWYVAVTQDVTPWGVLGLRADRYDPDADLFESRRGEFVPLDASLLTLSPAAGVRIPELASLIVQYDYVVDHLGRDSRGVPIDLPNDQWTARVQMEF